MRLSIYNQINDMLETLMEAINYMEDSANEEIIKQLLDNSSLVLSSIDETLTHNSASIRDPIIIEHIQKCQGIINELKEVVFIQGDDLLRDLDESVKQLQIMFKKHVQYKIRVVFFAELGQKWDAMNSVYEAFMNRKDCEVRVVLIPIFRRVNLNGETKTDVIYDDYLTELGIEFLHYEQYDISKDLPDMTFISNPYESVTLSEFWPENIAKYTRLVYIPYYTGRVINNNSIQTHCYFPVAKFAWRIIAQSKKIKDLHQKFAPKKGENVLVTGLPKWDEVFLRSEQPFDKESDWNGKLNGKKVFLWNSHYNLNYPTSTLLENGKAIIEMFSKKRDVALIWRPHPMTETIFKLYLPQYAPLWKEMKGMVEESDNIVIDKNPSYKVAFQYSDALISDYSSIIAEYMLTQKPILWMKGSETDNLLKEAEMLIQIDKLEQSYSPDHIESFVERIKSGIDLNKHKRMEVIKEDLPNVDGEIGERICKLLIEQFRDETK